MSLPDKILARHIEAVWRHKLSEHLPERLMNKIVGVYRGSEGCSIIYIGYKVRDFNEPWLSDQFLARVALEAP